MALVTHDLTCATIFYCIFIYLFIYCFVRLHHLGNNFLLQYDQVLCGIGDVYL